MQTRPTENEIRRYVNRKIGFYIHLAVYLIVNSGLLLLNLGTGPRLFWAAAPLLGWGLGLLIHGLVVFLNAPGASWKQRMLEREMSKHSDGDRQ